MSTSGIYGLSGSGMDIDSLVKTAMKAKQSQYDKMYKKETKQSWQKAAYNDFYTSMMTFKYSTLSNYKLQSSMSAMSATSSDSKVATVTANGEAAAMSHKITVNSLAKNAYLQTTSAGIKRDNTAATEKTSIYLKDIIQNSIQGGGIRKYNADTDVITFKDGTTLADASTVKALSFKVKDTAMTTTATNYTTSTKDAAGNVISGFIPAAAGKGTYVSSTGTVYNTVTTEEADKTIKTVLTSNSDPSVSLTYTTTTTDDKTQDKISAFRPAAGAATTTAYTTTTKDGSGNVISGYTGHGTYTSADGSVYNVVATTFDSDGAVVQTLDRQSGTGAATLNFTMKTVDSDGNTKNGFYPNPDTMAVNGDGSVTTAVSTATPVTEGSVISTSGTDTTTTTTAIDSDGNITTAKSVNAPNEGSAVVYTYKDLAEKTLNDLTLDISNANENVTASYDSVNDSVSIYNKNGGSKNLLSINAFTGTYKNADNKELQGATSTTMANALFNNLSLGMYDGTTLNAAQTMADGTPLSAVGASASVTIDGKTYGDLTSNKVTAAGISYSFVAKGSATVVASQDSDTIVKNVKQFVTDYNKLLDSLNDKIYETNYKSGSKSSVTYDPLTDAEKKNMSDDEVTAWEKKAKTGLLYQSSVLRNVVTSMRSALSTPVESVDSKYNTLSSIGISSSTNKGHIELDEEKLKKAMAADPDCVYQLFASGATSTSTTPDTANDGVAVRLDTVMKNALSSIATEAGTTAATSDQSNLGKLITAMQDKMDDFQEMMDDYQTQLYKKYDAMEAAISKLNSQTSYISQAFSG